VRLIHTSDWHLGHSLHRHSRHREHEAFLDWLLDELETRAADALLIAGDIFDTVNPSAQAQRQWYRFLARARRRCPALDIVVIGGNHDSAARLDAPTPLLAELDVHVVGGVRRADGDLEPTAMLARLTDADGQPAAMVAAVPFLRLADLPRVETEGDPAVEGVRAVYDRVLDAARAQMGPHEALIAMGHCYLTGTTLSELSERKVLGGNQHALPVDLFPADVAYVALGHLHLAQAVGAEHIRYCGSPIPLSLPERTYPHQIVVADFDGGKMITFESVRVPRTVDLLRVPASEAAEIDDVVAQLEALDAIEAGDDDRERWPFLEVHVRLPRPEPTLRARVEQALIGRRIRLARIQPHYTGTGATLGPEGPAQELGDLAPAQVFEQAWAARYDEPPSEQTLQDFHTLLDRVRQADP